MDADPDLFKAIGDATRRTILDELTDRDGFHHIDTSPLRSIVERWPIHREETNP